jgi:hypothetical protein
VFFRKRKKDVICMEEDKDVLGKKEKEELTSNRSCCSKRKETEKA